MGSRKKRKCKICGLELSGKFFYHLKTSHNLSMEDYYLKYIGKKEKCKQCGNITKLKSLEKGYNLFCGRSCQARCTHKINPDLVKSLIPFQKNNYHYLHTEEAKKKARINTTTETLLKAEQTRKKNGTRKLVCDIAHSKEIRKKATETLLRRNPNHFIEMSRAGGFSKTKKGFLYTKKAGKVFFRSSWEEIIYRNLDIDKKVKKFYVEPNWIFITLPTGKRYKPDIFIEYMNNDKYLIEIKPEYKLKDNEEKFKCAIEWCIKNKVNWQVWTQNNCGYLKNENIKERKSNFKSLYTSFRCNN